VHCALSRVFLSTISPNLSCSSTGGTGQRTVKNFSLDIPGIDPALPAANACTFALKDGNEDSDHK
jgi:hypothetical protein